MIRQCGNKQTLGEKNNTCERISSQILAVKKHIGKCIIGARTRRRIIFLARSKKIEYLLSYRFHKF